MSIEIKDRQKELQEAIRVLESKKEEIQTLSEKRRQLEIGEGNGVIEEAKTLKRQSIINFILGRVAKTEVNAADEAVSKAERADKLTSEMAEALESTLRQMASQIPNLQKAIDVAKTKLWEAIYNQIKRDAQKAVGDSSVKAIAAGYKCGSAYQNTLLDLFGTGEGPTPSITFSIINEAASRLAKEYGLED